MRPKYFPFYMSISLILISACTIYKPTSGKLEVIIKKSNNFEIVAENIIGKRFVPKAPTKNNTFKFNSLPSGDYILYITPAIDLVPECIIWKMVSISAGENKKIELNIPLNKLVLKCILKSDEPEIKNGTAVAQMVLLTDDYAKPSDKLSGLLMSDTERKIIESRYSRREVLRIIEGYKEEIYKIAPYYKQWLLFRKNKDGCWSTEIYWIAPGIYKITFLDFPKKKSKYDKYNGSLDFQESDLIFLLPVTPEMIKEGTVTYERD